MSAEHDRAVVAAQLGRAQASAPDVAVRCALGLPVVLRVPPVGEDGTPFPTRYWLSCPLAHRRVARIEASGEIVRVEAMLTADAAAREALADAHARYAADRARDVPADAPRIPGGGVAGIAEGPLAGVKCLHAHLAHHLVDRHNPIGELVEARVLPLDCTSPCCVDGEAGVTRNAAWQEPR
jgi:hypothetical protein